MVSPALLSHLAWLLVTTIISAVLPDEFAVEDPISPHEVINKKENRIINKPKRCIEFGKLGAIIHNLEKNHRLTTKYKPLSKTG